MYLVVGVVGAHVLRRFDLAPASSNANPIRTLKHTGNRRVQLAVRHTVAVDRKTIAQLQACRFASLTSLSHGVGDWRVRRNGYEELLRLEGGYASMIVMKSGARTSEPFLLAPFEWVWNQ